MDTMNQTTWTGNTSQSPGGPAQGEGRAWPLPLTSYGMREILACTVSAALLRTGAGYLWAPAAIPFGILWIAALLFFRDPPRKSPGDPLAFLSPADGKVTEITQIDNDERLGGPSLKIGIFLSVFDVHINRSPCPGTVRKIDLKAGRSLDARDPKSSTDNASNTIILDGGETMGMMVVKQITGLIARRIVCAAEVGDTLGRGQRYGMIKFGSRTELVVNRPDNLDVLVKIGDTVRAGRTILARRQNRG